MRMIQDWRRQEGKKELIKEKWGEEVPDYLWFYVAGVNRLTDKEFEQIVAEFFVGRKPVFGDIELHPSGILKNEASQIALRVRNATVLKIEFVFRGQIRPLYGVGHSDDKRRVNFYEICAGS